MANNEKERFLSMYREQVKHTIAFVENVDFEKYTIVPLDSESMFMGTRINRINIGSLIRHLIVAESHWFKALTNISHGEVVPIPLNASVIEGIEDGTELLEKLSAISEEGMNLVKSYDETRMQTVFEFVGLNYTVSGFLWALYAHHAFHKGQIDLLMRQMNYSPSEYMEYHNPPALVG